MQVERIIIRDSTLKDLPQILDIYNAAVVTTTATFDLHPESLESRTNWFIQHGKGYPLLVAETGKAVVAYCCLSKYSKKEGYSKTVELSIYVHRSFRHIGVGSNLMLEIIRRAKELGYHAIISGISKDNPESEALHLKFGFVEVGRLFEVGFKFGKWRDVSYFELILH